jgi:hypothetical protein
VACARHVNGDNPWRRKIGLEGQKTMVGRILKMVLVLAVLGFAGLTGYAYLGDLSPSQSQVTVPVTLNAD